MLLGRGEKKETAIRNRKPGGQRDQEWRVECRNFPRSKNREKAKRKWTVPTVEGPREEGGGMGEEMTSGGKKGITHENVISVRLIGNKTEGGRGGKKEAQPS